jgi:DNA-nicking Smr family endonuclease
MARIKIDLHDIYNNSAAIDRALREAFKEAIHKKIREVEIIPGKGSGQLRKKVERFLQLPHINPYTIALKMTAKTMVGCLFILNFERAYFFRRKGIGRFYFCS